MPYCVDCGSEIPEGQRVCSMCYGDPYYGHDGYYLEWLEQQQEEPLPDPTEPPEPPTEDA